MVFEDRAQAGELLAQNLTRFKGKGGVIYVLPRGGVVVGRPVADRLDLPLDLIIVRKIGHPSSKEYALGAVAEHTEVLNVAEIGDVYKEWLNTEIERQKEEIRRRKRIYYGGHQAISANGKIAILVDDGIATGYTMEVAIKEIKLQNPQKIVVAVPIVSPDVARRIEEEVDELIALDISLDFLGSVGAYYMNFTQVEDEEVIELLKK